MTRESGIRKLKNRYIQTDVCESIIEMMMVHRESFYIEIFRSLSISGSAIAMASGTKNSSFTTILSIWNTIMGSALLSMPWAFEKAGFAQVNKIKYHWAFSRFLQENISWNMDNTNSNTPRGIGVDSKAVFSFSSKYIKVDYFRLSYWWFYVDLFASIPHIWL